METSVITSKGQLLIPKSIRKKYGFEVGGKVIFEETVNGLQIRPVNEQFFKSFRGMLSSSRKLKKDMKVYKVEERKLEKRNLNLFKATKKK